MNMNNQRLARGPRNGHPCGIGHPVMRVNHIKLEMSRRRQDKLSISLDLADDVAAVVTLARRLHRRPSRSLRFAAASRPPLANIAAGVFNRLSLFAGLQTSRLLPGLRPLTGHR